ncbi:MAG: SNF2-related protein [Chloroflexota bacterium]|nr:SNF2-related protein [Chloroflexota bacterium]
MLSDHDWRLKYTPDDGDLVRVFYLPALEDAECYDRLTGYFKAGALTLAARGIEGLVRNAGRMRLLVGCTLDQPEIDAIERGENLRDTVELHMGAIPLEPADQESTDALELLAWMVAGGHLEVKVAVPCDTNRRPIPADGIFHEKSGVIEDRVGDRIAWTGSLNETAAGWRQNWESISVFKSWGEGSEPERVIREQTNFDRLWADESPHVVVLDAPEAARRDLLRFMPESDKPARLRKAELAAAPDEPPAPATEPPALPTKAEPDLRSRVWTFIRQAPSLPGGGRRVGEATAAVTPWPHQVRAFERLYAEWPPRLLIADEVGLGKTIQAGMLLRQAWLAGRAKRILVLAPKAVCRQWQIELREKFNLNWPIYDGRRLVRYPSPALQDANERDVGRDDWHKAPAVIVSSHLMRRSDRARSLLDEAETWDLIVVDEAHHARRRELGGSRRAQRPNAMLGLLQAISQRTQGLVLLTATPMQVHPVEVWDLLALLGLPPEWTQERFLKFFEDIEEPNPSHEALDRIAEMFRATEVHYGTTGKAMAESTTGLRSLGAGKVLRALRNPSSIARRRLQAPERRAAIAVARANTPIRRLVSRHTRRLLRAYRERGMVDASVAGRNVEDRLVPMSTEERRAYEAVGTYISSTYNKAEARDRNAVGFVMTTYRRRLASSFQALRNTLQDRLDTFADPERARSTDLDEDAFEDEIRAENWDAEDLAEKERAVLEAEEQTVIGELLDLTLRLPSDTKLAALKAELSRLRDEGYEQVMVFTQYTDTMDFLRTALGTDLAGIKLMCYSGRGGEAPTAGGGWRKIDRDEVKRRFRDGDADILLCTDAASEGLNFQFCGALVNYDMPWNPMRVEQRIGRIDRLGQRSPTIQIVNLHYEDTVETDVYQALRDRIGLFEAVVGRLQPILAELPRSITAEVLAGRASSASLAHRLEGQIVEAQAGGFDLDEVLEEDLEMPVLPESPLTMADLDRVISRPDLMPSGVEIRPMGAREYSLLAPGMKEALRVTTDQEYYEEHSESLELWSPGNPLFEPPERAVPDTSHQGDRDQAKAPRTLRDLLSTR